MSCKKCRHWFVNPNIVIPGEPTEGKCLVSEIKTQSNQVCNAWELSRIAELEHDLSNKEIEYTDLWDDMLEMQARIAELEEFKMIVEGCGFEVITEPPVLNHPERKTLKGHGTIYVPELPEPPEVK